MAGDFVGVEVLAELDEPPAGALGEADERVGDSAPVLGRDVDGDEGGDGVGGFVGDVADRAAELVVTARASAVEQLELVVVLGHPAEVGLKAALGLRPAVGSVGGGLGDGREEPVADLFEQCPVQLALGVEVLVEHRFRDSCGLRHVVHRGAVEPGLAEHLERHVEDLFPRAVADRRGLDAREGDMCYQRVTRRSDVNTRFGGRRRQPLRPPVTSRG